MCVLTVTVTVYTVTVTVTVFIDLFTFVLPEVAVGLISSHQMDSMSVKSTLLFDYYYRFVAIVRWQLEC